MLNAEPAGQYILTVCFNLNAKNSWRMEVVASITCPMLTCVHITNDILGESRNGSECFTPWLLEDSPGVAVASAAAKCYRTI